MRHFVQRFGQVLEETWSEISAQSREAESQTAALRAFVVAGCALTAIPSILLLVREWIVGDWIAVIILSVAIALIVLNLIAARREPYSIWPSRLMIAFAVFMIGHGIWFGDDQVRLIWPLVIPPIVLFVYGRVEGTFWTIVLFLPCAAYLATGAVDTSSSIDFLLAYLFSTLCAFVFQGLHAASRRQLASGELALRGEAEKFHDFADIDRDWFFELAPDYRVTYASGDILRSIGAAERSIVGRNLFELAHLLAPSDPGNREKLRAALDAGQAIRSCRFALAAQSNPLYVDISVKPYFDGRGELAGFRGVAADVTEVVKQEAELYEKERALYRAQKMEAVGQLTSGLAHDLNNILTVISGNLDLLRHHANTEERKHKYLQDATDATTRASDLMSALLAFARQQPLAPTRFELAPLLARLKPLLRRALGETYELSIELDEGLWAVNVDAAQLESSLLNLGLNARDAMQLGGRLAITCHNERVGEGDPQLMAGDYVRIDVTDTGSGIDDDIRGLVFDPFFTTKNVNEGSGLGLSMVFGFARQSHGDIRIARTSSEGTTFSLFLPCVAPEGDAQFETVSPWSMTPG